MKIACSVLLLWTMASSTGAFMAPHPVAPHAGTSSAGTVTQLNLFGGGAKKDGGEKKAMGMMDQLAMLKKAQEVATKKSKLDQELAAEDFTGTSTDGKVTAVFKYVPSRNPMDPSPEYDAVSFTFDDEFYESASTEDLNIGVKEAIIDAVKNVNKGVEEKYETLKGDIAETFGALGGGGAGLK